MTIDHNLYVRNFFQIESMETASRRGLLAQRRKEEEDNKRKANMPPWQYPDCWLNETKCCDSQVAKQTATEHEGRQSSKCLLNRN